MLVQTPESRMLRVTVVRAPSLSRRMMCTSNNGYRDDTDAQDADEVLTIISQ